MRLAWGIEEAIGDYLQERMPDMSKVRKFVPHVAVGIVNSEDVLVGAVALLQNNDFDGSFTIYLEKTARRLTPSLLHVLFSKIFSEMGLSRVSCVIARKNKRARHMAERLGFKMEGVKEKGFDGRRDAIMYGMTAENCRWIRG